MGLQRMQQRRDTSAGWAAEDPILLPGEIGYDTDERKLKVGDGTSVWSDLLFANLTLEDIAGVAPTLADLRLSVVVPGTLAGTTTSPLFVADKPLQVYAASIATYGSAVPMSDTDYWDLQLRRVRAGVASTIVSVRTNTSGVALPAKTGVALTGASPYSASAELDAGDIVEFYTTHFAGTPVDLLTPVVTLDYAPR